MEIININTLDLRVKNPFVSDYWSKVKSLNHWNSYAFLIKENNNEFELLLMTKKIFCNYYIGYIPFSPVSIKSVNQISLNTFYSALRIIKKMLKEKCILLKVDLPFEFVNVDINKTKFRFSKESIQPEATVRIDLTRSYDEILSEYKKRAKRNLKKNEGIIETKEVEINDININLWYSIYQETAKRDGFSLRNLDYIKSVLYTNSDVNKKFIFSYKDGNLVGGLIIIYSEDLAIYLFGASKKLDKHSPSYSMQDYAIYKLKEIGVKSYDFHGIGLDNKSSHLKSLTLFKTSFGGCVYKRPKTLDYPINKFMYLLYKAAEKIRNAIYR